MLPDYQKMYAIMVQASEQAINVLIDAQRKCEELYIEAEDFTPRIIPFDPHKNSDDSQP